jgi:urease accessory protein
MHLSKPHAEAGCLVVNLVNATAGLFDEDAISIRAEVEPGARVVLTNPSASRIYRSRSGRAAAVTQYFHVGAGGFLEYCPEPIIPHAGAIYDQTTVITADASAEILFFEWLAPGRTAAGEALQYQELRWKTDLSVAGKLIARERYRIQPETAGSTAALTAKFPCAHFLGAYLITSKIIRPETLEALSNETTYLGWSPLCGSGWSVRALCADALSMRRLLASLRVVFYDWLERPIPDLRRF